MKWRPWIKSCLSTTVRSFWNTCKCKFVLTILRGKRDSFTPSELKLPRGMSLKDGDIASSYLRSALICPGNACLWPKAIDGFVYVPYIISPLYGTVWIHTPNALEVIQMSNIHFYMVDDMDRITIEGGMQDISSGTCIKFIPRTHEPNFLDIQPRYGWVQLIHTPFLWLWVVSWSSFFVCVCCYLASCLSFLLHTPSCWSFLGQTGGSQILSLQTPGCMWSGVAAHELMHALGFVHEQSRSDRDNYVTIVWKNIMAGEEEWPD